MLYFQSVLPQRPPLLLVLTAVLLGGCAFTSIPPAHGMVVASGLNAPQGVYVGPDGSVYAVDSGLGGKEILADATEQSPEQTIGRTAQVVKVGAAGAHSVVATLPSIRSVEISTGASRLTQLGGVLYVTSGDWTLPLPRRGGQPVPRPTGVAALLQLGNGSFTELADLFAFEQTHNPDQLPPDAPGESGIHSHPYGLAASPDGRALYIADAGGNDLLKYEVSTRKLTLVAVFEPLEVVDEAGQTVTAQAVPTGVTFGPDGALYVSLFPGDPTTDGPPPQVPARVMRVDPQSGAVSEYTRGLTAVTDLQLGPDGHLYALSFAKDFAPHSGTVTRLKVGGIKEQVLGGLNYPTSIAFNRRGDAYLTDNGIGAAGSGRVLRYDFLTRFSAQ